MQAFHATRRRTCRSWPCSNFRNTGSDSSGLIIANNVVNVLMKRVATLFICSPFPDKGTHHCSHGWFLLDLVYSWENLLHVEQINRYIAKPLLLAPSRCLPV